MNAMIKMDKFIIESRIREALKPVFLEIKDRSQAHSTHAQAGESGIYEVLVVAEQFQGLGPLARHRLVYAATEDALHSQIHALSVRALTPEEQERQHSKKTVRKALPISGT